jgi:hypothetical protein
MTLLPPELGYELINPPLDRGEGFRFGRGTYAHVSLATFSTPERRTDRQVNARADGINVGREYFGGRTITFDINIKVPPGQGSAHEIYTAMERAWFTEDTNLGATRITPGEVSELVMTRHGKTKVAYGRPANIEPTTGRVNSGWIPVTATFEMITHKFYEEQWYQNEIGLVPAVEGGIEFPLEFPLATVGYSTQEDIVQVGGNTETWMLNTIYGPITTPVIDVVNYYTISTKAGFSLSANDYLEIDPRPWKRTIRLNGTIPVRGKFTQASRRISMQSLPPGNHQVVLRGTDPTGTSRLVTRWRNAETTW